MIRKIITGIAMCYFLTESLFCFAQNRDEIQKAFDAAFSQLNKNSITTGLLFENTYHQSYMHRYNGIVDTSIGYGEWEKIYADIYGMALNNSELIRPEILKEYTKNEYVKKINPLIIYNYDYNQIKETAFSGNMLKVSNNQIVDVRGKAISPYLTKRLFAFSPAYLSFPMEESTFLLDSRYYFSNRGKSLPNVEIDFNDGKGYQQINWGQEIKITYTDTNKKEMKIRILESGNILSAKADFQPAPSLGVQINANRSYPVHHGSQWIEDLILYKGERLRGLYSVAFGLDENGLRKTSITKPVIFIEGIDFGYNDYPQGYIPEAGKCGTLGFNDIINGQDYSPVNGTFQYQPFAYDLFSEGSKLVRRLNDSGYDFIYLDFEKGAEYMQKNAMVVVSLIQEINKLKSGCEENVIVGASMGGQVLRYALTYMEKNNIPHSTRLMVSYDSPNNGANIPIGLQYFINYYADKSPLFFKEANLSRSMKLTMPAARQLLVYHFENGGHPHSLRTTFLNELEAMGSYPKQLKKIAIASGSIVGLSQNFTNGDKLMEMIIPVGSLAGAITGATVGGTVGLLGGIIGVGYGALVGATVGGVVGHYIVHDYKADVFATENGSNVVFKGTAPGEEWVYKSSISTSKAYDNSPGGQNDAIFKTGFPQDGFFKELLVNSQKHTFFSFIPTSSALGMKPPFDNLTQDIGAALSTSEFNYDKYPFDGYWAPNINEPHVKLSVQNTDFFINEIKKPYYFITDELPAINKSNRYNFGNNNNIKLHGLIIRNGGEMHVNGNFATEYGDGPIPPQESSFTLETASCGMEVVIEDGGMMVLGTNTTNNIAYMSFNDLTTLRIKKGGKLIINNNSYLTIKKGARIVYEEGAEIQLLGENAVLDIKGSLELGQNATFTFTYPGTTSGYLKFSNNAIRPVANNIVAERGAKMLFKGIGPDDKVLEVVQDGLYIPDNLAMFEISRGKVELGAGTKVSVGCPLHLSFAKITSNTGLKNGHKGIHIYGQNQVVIVNSTFEKGRYGLFGQQFLGNNKLSLTASTVLQCDTGIYTIGAGVDFQNINFQNNLLGWVGIGLTSESAINNSTFDNNLIGLSVVSAGASSVSVDNTNIYNGFIGIDIAGGPLNIKCSSVKKHSMAGIWLRANAVLNASTIMNAGYVDMSENELSVYAEDARVIYLDEGKNNFSVINNINDAYCLQNPNSTLCRKPSIKGFLTLGSIQPAYLQCYPYYLNSNSNKWNSTSTQPVFGKDYELYTSYKCMSSQSGLTFDFLNKPIYINDYKVMNSLQSCNYANNENNNNPSSSAMMTSAINECLNCQQINTADFKNVRLNVAVKTAMDYSEQNSIGDTKSIDLFHQILTYPIASPSLDELILLDISYRKMLEVLSKVYQMKDVDDLSEGSSSSQMTEIQDQLIKEAKAQNFNLEEFYLTIEKAQTKLLNGNRTEAIAIFEQAQFISPRETDLEYLELWKCLLSLEEMIIKGEISKEEFISNSYKCFPSNTSGRSTGKYIIPEFSNLENSNTFEINVFPNPASEVIYIEFNLSEKAKVKMEYTDLYGQLIHSVESKSYPKGSNLAQIDIRDIKSGFYLLKITIKDEVYSKKINIIK